LVLPWFNLRLVTMGQEEVIFEPVSGVVTFFKSLDWSEPWLYGLAVSYLILMLGLYMSRRNSAVQMFTFVFLLVTVYIAEDINKYLAKNHHIFTKHQYFDSRGMFISVMMSTPLLLAAAFVAANWFKLSFELMTEVKIMQIKRQQRAAQKAENAKNKKSE